MPISSDTASARYLLPMSRKVRRGLTACPLARGDRILREEKLACGTTAGRKSMRIFIMRNSMDETAKTSTRAIARERSALLCLAGLLIASAGGCGGGSGGSTVVATVTPTPAPTATPLPSDPATGLLIAGRIISPDGTKTVLVETLPGANPTRLFVQPAGGSPSELPNSALGANRLSLAGGASATAIWSPGSDKVFYETTQAANTSGYDGAYVLRCAAFGGGVIKQIQSTVAFGLSEKHVYGGFTADGAAVPYTSDSVPGQAGTRRFRFDAVTGAVASAE